MTLRKISDRDMLNCHFLKLIYAIGDPHQGPLYRETVGPVLYRQAFCMITHTHIYIYIYTLPCPFPWPYHLPKAGAQERIQGGGPGGQDPPPFGGPPNFIKKEKMARLCARKLRILVLNSYPDPPLFEILYPPLEPLLKRPNQDCWQA